MGPRQDTPFRTPLPSMVLGYGPAGLILALALAGWLLRWGLAIEAARLWAAAILIFLGGVTRGLSFFTEGGPQPAQMVVMFFRFLIGLAALVLPLTTALLLLAAGWASMAFTDPPAAARGEAPRYFAQLRPPQSALAVAGLILCALLSN